jgi:hypothetical protein
MSLKIAWITIFVLYSGFLFGCVQNGVRSTTELTDTPGSPIMEYRWYSDYARVIGVPSDISKATNKQCVARGFDKSFMLRVSTDGPYTSAVFSCRGSDL